MSRNLGHPPARLHDRARFMRRPARMLHRSMAISASAMLDAMTGLG